MLGTAHDRIMEIRQDAGSRRSGTSRSSSQVSRSHRSEESLVTSSLSKRAVIAANVARLKTELEFVDGEAQRSCTLKEHKDKRLRWTQRSMRNWIEAKNCHKRSIKTAFLKVICRHKHFQY